MIVFKTFTTLRPMFVTLIYILAMVILAIATEMQSTFPGIIKIQPIIWALVFLIPIGWSIGVNVIISSKNHYKKRIYSFLYIIILFFSLAYTVFIFISSFYYIEGVLSQALILEFVFVGLNFAGFICIPAIFWITAKRMVDFENTFVLFSRGTIITFLQIIYLPIGIYWLFPRVQKYHSIAGDTE